MMAGKRDFSDLTVEAGTMLLSRKQSASGGIDFVYETWEWDGMYGHSVIVYSDDVKGMKDADLKEFIRPLIKEPESSVTITRKEKYTFINFNFDAED